MTKINSKKIYANGRVWLDIGDKSFIGHGKIELIEKIQELGSLRKAALNMKMSYQKAWFNINEINTIAKQPLVILKRGGKEGGIAQITEYGEKIILQFKKLQDDFKIFIEEKSKNIEI